MYAYWVCAARKTPIFSPEFPFRSISFSQITQKSVPEHHHFICFGGFCRSGDHHFQNDFNFNPFIASTAGSAAAAWRPEIRIFTLKTDQARSGAPHFQAQNGSSSFRSPAFSRSTGSSFRSPGPFFTLPRHIPTKIWLTPPPPPDSPSPFVIFTYRVLLLSNSKVLPGAGVDYCRVRCLLQY